MDNQIEVLLEVLLSTEIEEVIPFIDAIYEEGDDDYLNDILGFYCIAPTKFEGLLYTIYKNNSVIGVCFVREYNNTKWLMWCKGNVSEYISIIMNKLNIIECYAHVEKYDDKKIQMLVDNNFIHIGTVKEFRVSQKYPKNFFYYDKDYVMKGSFSEIN